MSDKELEVEIAELKSEVQSRDHVMRQYRKGIASLSTRLELCQDRKKQLEGEVRRLRYALESIKKFGHEEGHGCRYTCASMAADTLSEEDGQ